MDIDKNDCEYLYRCEPLGLKANVRYFGKSGPWRVAVKKGGDDNVRTFSLETTFSGVLSALSDISRDAQWDPLDEVSRLRLVICHLEKNLPKSQWRKVATQKLRVSRKASEIKITVEKLDWISSYRYFVSTDDRVPPAECSTYGDYEECLASAQREIISSLDKSQVIISADRPEGSACK